jgi:regulation of enolase protein 1 (concanavalin A-like superfamily)
MSQNVVFRDAFEGDLDSEWSWLREAPEAWRLEANRLRIRALPGTLWGARNDARNVLLGPSQPLVDGIATEVVVTNQPALQGEQAGIIWYVDDATYVKLVKECLEGTVWIVLAREENDQGTLISRIPFEEETAHVRLSLRGGDAIGEVRAPNAAEWQTVGTCAPPAANSVRPGICVHGGPADEVHWADLSTFAIHR